jgi:hypothetical protein
MFRIRGLLYVSVKVTQIPCGNKSLGEMLWLEIDRHPTVVTQISEISAACQVFISTAPWSTEAFSYVLTT